MKTRTITKSTMKKSMITLIALGAGLLVSTSHASVVAHYDFSDGNLFDDETGNGYTLTQSAVNGTGITLNGDGVSAHFDSTSGPNYLTAATLDGAAYTVSMWFKADVASPSGNSSIMSTTGSNNYQLEYNSEVQVLGAAGGPIGDGDNTQVTAGTWYHAVVSTDGTDANLYLSAEGGSLTLIDTRTMNLGMDDLRIGVNRAGNLTWEGDYAGIAIYDEELSAGQLTVALDRGVGGIYSVPEPSTLALLGCGLALLAANRRRMTAK